MNTLINNWWIFLFVPMLALLYYLESKNENRKHMQATLRTWLQSSRRQLQTGAPSTPKQKEISELNASASRFFRLAYLFDGNPALPKTRPFFAVPGWVCMNFFAISVLVSMVDVRLTGFGTWGDVSFVGFVLFFSMDICCISMENQYRRTQAIPVTVSARIVHALQKEVGDRHAQEVLLGKIKTVFGETAPELPAWWSYGLIDRWLPAFLQANRNKMYAILIILIPFLFFAIKQQIDKQHGVIGHIVSIAISTVLVTLVFAISWLWPFDAIQDVRPWQGGSINGPTFQMLVFWRDLEDSE
jgi:hypothetical protein